MATSINGAVMGGSATALLAQHPERATLEAIFAEMMALLEVQQAVLLLSQEQGDWTPIFCRGVGEETWPVAATWPLHLQVRPEKGPSPACFYADWIEVAAPLVCDGSLVGVALLGPRVPDAGFNRLELTFVEQMVGAMAMTASILRLFEASRAMSRRLLHVQERERTYLASLLHDEPLQRLTLLAGRMDALACQAAGTAQTAPLAAEVQGQREALLLVLRQLRHICAGLHSPLLDPSIGLAMEDAVEALARESDLDVWAQIDLHPEQLVPEPASTARYHVLLEALTNVRKHACATSVNVILACQEGTLTLSVEDDGCGFDIASASLSDLVRRHHFGLVGMHE
jgi:signal transduction histidine kinase